MTMFTSRTINFFNLMKRLGQVLLLFVLGACLLILSTLLVSASGQWGWLAFGILVGTLPFFGFYLAGFFLAPKRFYQTNLWKNQSSSLRWGVVIVCAASSYISMGELNSVADLSVVEQPMPLLEQLLITLGAVILLTGVYMPLRAITLFRCLGMGRTNAIGEVFDEHNKDTYSSLAVPPLPMSIMMLVIMCYSLTALSTSNAPEGAKYLLFFLLEITAALDIAYVYRNCTKGGPHFHLKDPAAPQA
ncbi:hypothetical protein [Vibrio parahaemolyticus]|uniref:hypothetical protein n=1 Tax=Vibrio parahaemolyticus TaxID=670 RepID=UPI0027E57D4A|nr:hypothetical protein [Vibrio parahaemolyticus]WMN82040.1 hypothetical protein NI384_09730 [Vibrio parahaemolyticus]